MYMERGPNTSGKMRVEHTRKVEEEVRKYSKV
jgi:hypothetical protein